MLKKIISKFNECLVEDIEALMVSILYQLKKEIEKAIAYDKFSVIFSSDAYASKNYIFSNSINYEPDFEISFIEKRRIYSFINLHTFGSLIPFFSIFLDILGWMTTLVDINRIISNLLIKNTRSNIPEMINTMNALAKKKFSEINQMIQRSLVPTEDMKDIKNNIECLQMQINKQARGKKYLEQNHKEKLFEKINFSQIQTEENQKLLIQIKNSFQE